MGWLNLAFGRRDAGAQAPVPVPVATQHIAWREKGNAALAAGDIAEAARCYAEGVRLEPADPVLRLNLGFALLEQGQPAAAAQSLQQALALRRPDDGFVHDAHYLLGRAQAQLGEHEQALAQFAAAAGARTGFTEPLAEGVRLLARLERQAQAVEWAQRLVARDASLPHQLLLAAQLANAGRCDEGLALLDALRASEPRNVEVSVARFHALADARRWPEALAEAQRTVDLTGPHPGAFANVAAALEKLGRLEEAVSVIERALDVEPGHLGAHITHVTLLTQCLRLQEAADAAQAALQRHPDEPELHWNLSIVHLLRGAFSQGWREHEWRLRVPALARKVLQVDAPGWHGESLAGRTILLHGEQGHGDNIQFLRLLPRVAAGAAGVVLRLDPALHPLLRGFLPANVRLLAADAPLPVVDCHASLLSLPAILDLGEAEFAVAGAYLRPDPEAVRRWRDRLPARGRKVGVAWCGNPGHANDHNRSMPLATFQALATPGCHFVTVQPELRPADRDALARWPAAVDLGRELRDFADTAALIAALDLVVTVDTAVAHLAGALGKPVWILLPRAPDWRWLLDRTDSPWYPSARLYRQEAHGEWSPVLERVRADLQAFAPRN